METSSTSSTSTSKLTSAQIQRDNDNQDEESLNPTPRWTLVPNAYNLDTVGIGPLFISSSSSPPSPPSAKVQQIQVQPSPDDNISSPNSNSNGDGDGNGNGNKETYEDHSSLKENLVITTQFFTNEMVGKIKSCPKDFIVREILCEDDFLDSDSAANVDAGADVKVNVNVNTNVNANNSNVVDTSSSEPANNSTTISATVGNEEKSKNTIQHIHVDDEDRKRRIRMKRSQKIAYLTDTRVVLPPPTFISDSNDNNHKKSPEEVKGFEQGHSSNTDEAILMAKKSSLRCMRNSVNEHSKVSQQEGDVKSHSCTTSDQTAIDMKTDEELRVPIPPSKVKKAKSPIEVIQFILEDCIQNNNSKKRLDRTTTTETYLELIQNIYNEALSDISNPNTNRHDNHVVIPPIDDSTLICLDTTSFASSSSLVSIINASSAPRRNHRNRGIFHRTLKIVFPLLSSSTFQHDDDDDDDNDDDNDDNDDDDRNKNNNDKEKCVTTAAAVDANNISNNVNRQQEQSSVAVHYNKKYASRKKKDSSGKQRCSIKIVKDTTFHSIIPFLSHPQSDLVHLYRFRNRGCVYVAKGKRKHNHTRGRGNKRRRRNENSRDGCHGKAKKGNDKNSEEVKETDNNDNEGNNREEEKAAKNSSPDPTQIFLRLKTNLSKEKRRDVHHLIGKVSCGNLGTTTVSDFTFTDESDSAQTCIAIAVFWSEKAERKIRNIIDHSAGACVATAGSSNGAKSRNHRSMNTLCVVKKENVEHLAAMKHLTVALKCKQRDIGFAGMKDMCAITTQFCTLRNVSHANLQKANAYLKHWSIKIGNFESVPWSLQPGMLMGNEFEITVRDIRRVEIRKRKDCQLEERFVPYFSEKQIDTIVDSIRTKGFVNFFGEQRVGNAGPKDEIGVRPFDIGRAMLKKDFTRAIDLLMTGRNKLNGEYVETPKMRRVRQLWKESGRDPAICLSSFPKDKMVRERTVMQGLKRYGKPLEALRCLSYSVRMFWINAYQSYVWNKMATERLKLGTTPLLGDLYVDSQNNEIKVVTDPSCVSMTQIVLPLPGYNVQYPNHSIGKMYRHFLEKEEGIWFLEKDKGVKVSEESTAKGGYRRLIVLPNYIDWKPVEQELAGYVKTAKFTFSLPPGSYATMLLRELMKSQVAR